jgi:hypothetical protein
VTGRFAFDAGKSQTAQQHAISAADPGSDYPRLEAATESGAPGMGHGKMIHAKIRHKREHILN